MLRIIFFLIMATMTLIGMLLGLVLRLVLFPFPAARSLTHSTLVWTGARL